ncbi:MAG: DUF1491 family protein [Parvibaculales bacterium]
MLRLKAGIYVNALVRRIFAVGSAAFVARHGDDDAGGIFIRVNRLDGHSGLLTQFSGMEGEAGWRVLATPQTPDSEVDALLQREINRDPDLWVVEIEDKAGRHFLEEKIMGDWE